MESISKRPFFGEEYRQRVERFQLCESTRESEETVSSCVYVGRSVVVVVLWEKNCVDAMGRDRPERNAKVHVYGIFSSQRPRLYERTVDRVKVKGTVSNSFETVLYESR